jgi:hypothetical protein
MPVPQPRSRTSLATRRISRGITPRIFRPIPPRLPLLSALAGLVLLVAVPGEGPLSQVAGPAFLEAQTTPPVHPPATMPPESERNPDIYTLIPDGRHGPSHFPRVRHPEVEYEAGDVLTWDRYHTVDVMDTWLRRWAERHPDLVEVYQVGTSYEGRPILQATITNTATGPATDKPAAFFEGGRHSGEITSSESVLWLMQHLVEGYGSDPEITALLDRAAIYLRPQNNPDGSNLYLHTAQTNRSSVRPVDQDGDGLFDEDPLHDLDGDGVVRQMRWRDPEGTFIQDPRDPSGRLMQRVAPGEGEWSVAREGIDHDGDGRMGEDGIGGLDLHRNYPMNWRPMPGREHTGRGFTQGGAGAHPLSEPETMNVVLFLLENPNIKVVNSMDTRVPMHLRPPSTSKSEESIYPEDLAHYIHFDSVGLSITGYPWAGDVYHTYATRNNPEGSGNPLFGHGPDFGYFYYGSIWYGDELWDGGSVGDLNNDGVQDDLDRLIWVDSVAGGRPFQDWTPAQHPTLGEVEVGGFHPKFFQQNGPPEVLEPWAANQALFNLYMAQSLPHLRAGQATVRRTGTTDDGVTWEIGVQVTNEGRLPTSLRQARLVKIVRPDWVEFRVEGRQGVQRVELGHLEGGETKDATVTFTLPEGTTPTGTFRVLSTRGGVVEGGF